MTFDSGSCADILDEIINNTMEVEMITNCKALGLYCSLMMMQTTPQGVLQILFEQRELEF